MVVWPPSIFLNMDTVDVWRHNIAWLYRWSQSRHSLHTCLATQTDWLWVTCFCSILFEIPSSMMIQHVSRSESHQPTKTTNQHGLFRFCWGRIWCKQTYFSRHIAGTKCSFVSNISNDPGHHKYAWVCPKTRMTKPMAVETDFLDHGFLWFSYLYGLSIPLLSDSQRWSAPHVKASNRCSWLRIVQILWTLHCSDLVVPRKSGGALTLGDQYVMSPCPFTDPDPNQAPIPRVVQDVAELSPRTRNFQQRCAHEACAALPWTLRFGPKDWVRPARFGRSYPHLQDPCQDSWIWTAEGWGYSLHSRVSHVAPKNK